jgi:hypothetical protein
LRWAKKLSYLDLVSFDEAGIVLAMGLPHMLHDHLLDIIWVVFDIDLVVSLQLLFEFRENIFDLHLAVVLWLLLLHSILVRC